MICFGIESTAHTFGISIVNDRNKEILSSIIATYKTKQGGLIPAKLAEHHVEVLEDTLRKAFEKAKIKPK